MKPLLIYTTLSVLSIFCNAQLPGYSQNLKKLDDGFFKWRRFSFIQEWDTLKSVCDLEKIDAYSDFYLDFYCGNISDTTKSYYLRNESYHNFNRFQFDQAILHLVGSKISPYNLGALIFTKKFDLQTEALSSYHELLESLKQVYGNSFTQRLGKFRQERLDIMEKNAVYSYLSDDFPFDSVERTEWKGEKHIIMRLDYVPDNSLVVLAVKEYATNNLFKKPSANLFAASEYSEHFTSAFQEFDRRNGFKKLKFGMSPTTAKMFVTLKPNHLLGEYEVTSGEYSQWYNLEFNSCDLTFNKKDKLYDVQLLKIDFSNEDYNKLLQDMYELLGTPSNFKQVSAGSEFTRWKGKQIQLIVLRGDHYSITVDINCPAFDDSSPSDKLY